MGGTRRATNATPTKAYSPRSGRSVSPKRAAGRSVPPGLGLTPKSRASKPPALKPSARPSYLFVPNLIGYARVALQLASYVVALRQPLVAVACYCLAQALDAVDGYAARVLGECSELGRVLDMVTDRTSTACLCLVLARLYPQQIGALALLVTLDLFSHWFHMHASLVAGAASHKEGAPNWVVRAYYHKPVLFAVCAMTELWYVSLYAAHFAPHWMPALGVPFWTLAYLAATPFWVFKQLTNVVQLVDAVRALVQIDAEKRA